MNNPKANIDSASVMFATSNAIGHAQECVENALRYSADPDRKKRLAEGYCKRCFYLWRGRIGGAAMTNQPCGVCSKDVLYGSTATDKLCEPCAVSQELCRQCGGDLHMRPRRMYGQPKAKPAKLNAPGFPRLTKVQEDDGND